MRDQHIIMLLEVHILSHDSERMLGWAIRHYRSMGTSIAVEGIPLQVLIVVHDGGPKHTQRMICCDHAAEWQEWDTGAQLNDELAMKLKNECWKNSDADWVAVVDADELLYFPQGAHQTLQAYEKRGAVVIKPYGFEMFSEEWRDYTTFDEVSGVEVRSTSQITDWVKMGAPEDKWYSKPVLFSPKRLAESGLGIGAHESRPVLKDGRALYVNHKWPKANPPTYMLHCHQLGPIEMVAARYDATRARLAEINERNRWGNFVPGIQHAQEKRDLIIPHLQQVIP